MGETHIIRIFVDRPDLNGLATETIHQHLEVVGPDVFTPSGRMLRLTEYHEEMRCRGGNWSMTMRIEFMEWKPGEPMRRMVQNWDSLVGKFPIPRADPDGPAPGRIQE